MYISPTWGAAPIEPLSTKFGNSLNLTDVFIRSIFYTDWYSSFGSGEVQSLPSPIGTTTGPYTTLQPRRACKCLTVADFTEHLPPFLQALFQSGGNGKL